MGNSGDQKGLPFFLHNSDMFDFFFLSMNCFLYYNRTNDKMNLDE